MVKFGICGKMASGKTTFTRRLQNHIPELVKLSFADKLYEICHDLFGMVDKDRKLLQDVGTRMKQVDSNVWVNYTMKIANSIDNVIIDDARYKNEILELKKNNFTLIKLNISEAKQKQRLIETYPNTYPEHLDRRTHSSETEIDLIDDDIYDFIIDVDENGTEDFEISNLII